MLLPYQVPQPLEGPHLPAVTVGEGGHCPLVFGWCPHEHGMYVSGAPAALCHNVRHDSGGLYVQQSLADYTPVGSGEGVEQDPPSVSFVRYHVGDTEVLLHDNSLREELRSFHRGEGVHAAVHIYMCDGEE